MTWESLLIPAIPATIAGVASIVAAGRAKRGAALGDANREHLEAIGRAVNVPPPSPTTPDSHGGSS